MNAGLSLAIPAWNGRDLLERYLPSVTAEAHRWSAAHGAACEIVVCDDGSTDGTPLWLAAHYPEVRCHVRATNGGFAYAANDAVAAATAELVVLLNNDLELAPGALEAIPAWFEREPNLFALTLRGMDWPEQRFATGGKLGRFRRGFWETWRNYEAPAGESFMAVGGFCAFRRAWFLALGGFDLGFAPYYSEDLDLSYRARKRGWTIAYEPASVVYHAQGASVSRHRGRFARTVVIERNRLLFHWRNLDRSRLAGHLLWAHLLLAQQAVLGNFAYHLGYAQAVARLPAVARFRQCERQHWRRRDRELELATPPPVAASATEAEGAL